MPETSARMPANAPDSLVEGPLGTLLGLMRKQVWRSTRDWDMTSRELLATYLQAADVVAREKQARPDTAVHVRLGGENACNNGNRDKPDNNTTHDSHAVWAVTATGAVGTRVNVACSRRAQTQVPLSAIQRVQVKEQVHCEDLRC